jgi:protein tyrosine phosphatase
MFHYYPKLDKDVHLILEASDKRGALYLGNSQSQKKLDFLNSIGVQAVLSVTSNMFHTYSTSALPYHKILDVEDEREADLKMHFQESAKWINQHIKEGRNVLVHCHLGVSRSSSIVIAYLMRYQNMSLKQSIEFVKSKRECIQPNPGFMEQLEKYEKELPEILGLNDHPKSEK